MSLSIKQLSFAFILIFCYIFNPQDTTKENALGGSFIHHGKIFGPGDPGRLIKRKDYPFLVLVRALVLPEARICTGSLVSLQAVLTNSFCLQLTLNVSFWAGNCRYIYDEDWEPPTQHRKMTNFFVSTEVFGNTTVGYGTVVPAFEKTDYVQPVGLYLKHKTLHASWHDDCTVLGFGVSSPVMNDSGIGRYMVQKIWSRTGCYDMPPVEAHMCADKDAFNKTICGGDEGGPVLCNDTPGKLQQFGVTDWRMSFETKTNMDLDCFLPQKENRYFYVGYFRDFLMEIPGLPPEDKHYDPVGQREQPSKLSGSRRLTVPVLMLPVTAAFSALSVLTLSSTTMLRRQLYQRSSL